MGPGPAVIGKKSKEQSYQTWESAATTPVFMRGPPDDLEIGAGYSHRISRKLVAVKGAQLPSGLRGRAIKTLELRKE